MRELVPAVVVLFISLHASAAIPIQPTTTLTAETSNNTSAANSFKSQSNGNLGAGNVSKLPLRDLLYPGSTTKIYVHLMPWFGPSNHVNVGYDSASATQVKRQVQDMISRGIDGAIVDWYGPLSTHHDTATMHLMREAELHTGFEFAITEDVGSIKFALNPQQKLIDDLNYVNSTYAPSPAYMRRGGRPVIFFFGVEEIAIDWNVVRGSVLGNPLFIFRNSGAFTKPQTNGGFSWLAPQTTVTNGYMSLGHLDNFYSIALTHPSQESFGSGFKGFDDSLASWGKKRKIQQFCGQTWLSSMAQTGKFYNSGKQLESLQIVTWNDYEEGSEIETGVDNCLSISASVQGSTLSWNVTGNENTLAGYTVFISQDGQNLMKLAELAPGNRLLNLDSFDVAAGSYTFYVKAEGKPSIVNHMSNPVSFPPKLSIAAAPTALTLRSGQAGNFTVSVTPQASSFNSAITFSCSGLPAQGRCAFSPAAVTLGAQPASTNLTVFTSATSAAKQPPGSGDAGPLYGLWLAGAGIFGAVVTTRTSKRRLAALAVLLVGLGITQVGCGSTGSTTSSSSSQAAALTTGTYTIVITGTSGSEKFSTTVTMVVQ